MNEKNCIMEVKKEGFFEKIKVKATITNEEWLKEVVEIVNTAIRFYSINESNIEMIQVERQENNNVRITIEYRKVTVSSLTSSKDMREQIIAVLGAMDYTGDKIKHISHEKHAVNGAEPAWYVKIGSDYDADESLSQRDEEISLNRILNKMFNERVVVSFE